MSEEEKKLETLLNRLSKCDPKRWYLKNNAMETGFYRVDYPRETEFGITRMNPDKVKRYKMLLIDVMDNPTYFKNFPKFDSLEELEMRLDLLGY